MLPNLQKRRIILSHLVTYHYADTRSNGLIDDNRRLRSRTVGHSYKIGTTETTAGYWCVSIAVPGYFGELLTVAIMYAHSNRV